MNQIAIIKETPDHVKNATGLGNENVSFDSLQTPRLKLLQDMSGEVKKSDPRYIKGAEAGMILNTVANKAYEEMFLINIKFDSGIVAFEKMTNMPFKAPNNSGLFESIKAAEDALIFEGRNPEDYDIKDSHMHSVLVLDPETGKPSPATMDFMKTKVKASKEWNTLISDQGGDRFSSIWHVKPVVQTYNGNSWYNYSFEFYGWCDEDTYELAKKIHASLP